MILNVFPRRVLATDPPSAWRKVQDLLSSSANLLVDVMIRAIPRYRPIYALLNQFCSLLSAGTSISLRLNSSDLLLSLETFNKKEIFFSSCWSKKYLCLDNRPKIKLHISIEPASLHFAQIYPSSVSKTVYHGVEH